MVQNEASSFFSHAKIINVKSPLLYHIQLWHFFKKLSLSRFIIYLAFLLCGIFHSWYLLKISHKTISNNLNIILSLVIWYQAVKKCLNFPAISFTWQCIFSCCGIFIFYYYYYYYFCYLVSPLHEYSPFWEEC